MNIRALMLIFCLSFLQVQSSFAGDACIGVFSAKFPAVSISKIDEFFTQIYGSSKTPKELLELYEKEITNKPLSKLLFKALQSDGATSKIMLRLGYRLLKDRLVPPKSLSELYFNIYKEIFAAAERIGLEPKDTILPAVILEGYGENYGKQIALRPGIDDPPKGEWQILNGELKSEDFTKHIASGKMPSSIEMLFHDIGHLIDFIDRPDYMKAYREFSRLKIQMHDQKKEADDYKLKYLELFMNEYLYLARPQTKQILESLVGVRQSSTRKTLTRFYENLDAKELLTLAKKFLNNEGLLYRRHGGGSRDGSDLKQHSESDLLGRAAYDIYGKTKNDKAFYGSHIQYLHYELPLLFQRLQYLLNFPKLPPELKAQHIDYANYSLKLEGFEAGLESFEQGLPIAIKQVMIEIELQLQTLVSTRLSEEQVAKDVSLLLRPYGAKFYRASMTYRYFYTVAKPETTPWNLFVEVDRP